ncbi:MAG: cation diffusion facilitator family transporter [Paracoccaceae bacterium]
MTGSIALMSDALESTVNVATAVAALIAIRVAMVPADDNHPYGHHKAEFLSAVLEGVMIIIAALLILREAVHRVHGAACSGGAAFGAGGERGGQRDQRAVVLEADLLRAPAPVARALVADGHHLLSDVISSVGVTLGVLLAIVTGWAVLDPALAALVAVNILWSGWKVMTSSLSGLMDEAVDTAALDRIRTVISEAAEGAIEAHDLRTRHAGRATFIDFHLVVDGAMSVTQAHDICDRIEKALKAEMPQAQIAIHVEPDDKAKQSGVLVL